MVAIFYRYMYLRKGGRVKKNTCICGGKEAHAAYMQSAVTTTRSSAAASKCVPENKNVAKVRAEGKNITFTYILLHIYFFGNRVERKVHISDCIID